MKTVHADAPFDMPSISVPDFSSAKHFLITEFGARPDNQRATSKAIATAIDLAHRETGKVVIPSGNWPTGPIHLKSRVNLHLEKGATLTFSDNPQDYLPAVWTSWEGLECYNYSPLIYALNCQDVALSGSGKLVAKLDVWRQWYARPEAHLNAIAKLYHQAAKGEAVKKRQMAFHGADLRPHFVQFNRCRNVLIEDITIENSPFWVLHPYMCKDVVIRRVNVKAHGHNNDGVDPEMSQNVLIEDCIFDQGDDAVSVKAGRNQDAWRLDTPSRNIIMRNCRIKSGHQLMAIGSELSGGIENILVENCQFDFSQSDRPTPIFNLLFIKTNERRGGFVRNIHMRNIEATEVDGSALCVDTDVLYQWRDLVPTYERRLTDIDGIHIENIRMQRAAHLLEIQGQQERKVRNVSASDIECKDLTSHDVVARNLSSLSFK